MITLAALADLADAYRDDLGVQVEPLKIGDQTFDVNRRPALMGCVNLSRDSTYRESIAVSTESAIRKGRIQSAEGADFIDLGAESTTASAGRVGADEQIAALVPVIEALTNDDILVSAETYEPHVVRACLAAGANVLNLTGTEYHQEIYELAAEFNATVILCYVGGRNVREITDVTVGVDPIPGILDHFGERVELARSHGVTRIAIDPGMGFYYGNLVDPTVRIRHQTRVLLNTFRLRRLGLPVCHAVPHAFTLFEEQFRSAEAFFAVLAQLGGTGIIRTHEVARVAAVVGAMGA
ncbi:MAG: dihydropteroate synthase, partial [Actinobacteria bacterium]|nr:dihydropteroate synthase [Actinomycetota bacterium]